MKDGGWKSSSTGQQLFFDDLESGTAALWTPYDGSWSVCQVGNNSKEYCAGSTAASYSSDFGSSWVTLGSGTDGTWSSGNIGVRAIATTARFDQIKVISD